MSVYVTHVNVFGSNWSVELITSLIWSRLMNNLNLCEGCQLIVRFDLIAIKNMNIMAFERMRPAFQPYGVIKTTSALQRSRC